jgi:hypothetical protein
MRLVVADTSPIFYLLSIDSIDALARLATIFESRFVRFEAPRGGAMQFSMASVGGRLR